MNPVLLYSATLCVGITCGICFAVAGGVITDASFLKYFSYPTDTILELFVGSQSAGCVVGAILAGPTANHLGRHSALTVTTSVGLISTLLLATPLFCSTSLWLVFTGRTLQGVCIGALLSVWPVYLNEVLSADERGSAGAMLSLMINVGVMGIIAIESALLNAGEFAWCCCLAIQLPFLAMFLMALQILPESPSWLQNSSNKPPPSNSPTELVVTDTADVNLNELCTGRALVGALVAGMQSACGIDLIVNYSPGIFARARGEQSAERHDLFYSIGVGGVLIVGTLLVSLVIDHVGRRTMLLVGSAGMSVSFLGASCATEFGGPLIICTLLVFTAFFSMTWAPLAFVVPSELVKFRVRAYVQSIGTVLNFLAAMCVVSSWLSLVSSLGQAWAFLCYAGVNATIFIFVLSFVPETKDHEACLTGVASDDKSSYGSM